MRAIINTLAAVFLIALTMFIVLWARSLEGGGSNFGEQASASLTLPIISAALMLCGVLFGALYAELQHEEQLPIVAMARAFQRPGLYRALLVAPIVFAGVYTFARSNSDGIMVAIFAFQNGFFCESIFRKTTASQNVTSAKE